MKRGKKYSDSAKLVDKAKLYDTDEAIKLLCQTAKANFDETVELHVRLVLTLVTQTNRYAVRWYCRMVPVKQFAHWCSRKATVQLLPKKPVQTMSVRRIW